MGNDKKKYTTAQKEKLYQLYGWARTAQREGKSYQEINDEISKLVGAMDIHGQAGLEKALGMYDEEMRVAEDVAGKGRGEKLTESVMNVGDAMLFGYGGEAAGLAAGIGAAVAPGGQGFGEAFRETQAGADQLIQGARETSGVAAGIGRAAGMGATGIIGGAAAGGGRAAATGSLPLRAKLARGVGTGIAGAAGGAFEGASDPNAAGGRVGGALRGAKWGGGIGLGLGLGIPLVGAAAGAIGSKVGAATKPMRKRAQGLLANILEESDVPPGMLPEVMEELPAGSAVADISGSLRRKARAVRNMSPDLEDSPELRGIARRQYGTGERMIDDLRGAAGLEAGYQPKRVFKASRKLWKRNQLEPLLETNPKISGAAAADKPGLKNLVEDNREMRRALRKGGVDLDDLDSDHDFEKLWAAREELLHRAASRDLNGFERGQAYDAIDGLTTLLDDRAPGFGDMIGQYKQIKAVETAFETGEAIGSKSVRELEAALEDLGDEPEVQEAFKQGLASWFEKGLEDTTAGGAVSAKLRSMTPRMQSRLKALFGGKSDELAAYVEDTLLNQEQRWNDLHRAISGNSSTAQQLSDIDGVLNDPSRAPAIRDFVNRVYLLINTSPGTRRETLLELGKLMLDGTMTPSQIKLLSDSMADMMAQQGIMARRTVATMGAGASELGPSMFGEEEPPQAGPKTTIF